MEDKLSIESLLWDNESTCLRVIQPCWEQQAGVGGGR